MRKGDLAQLKMQKTLCVGGETDAVLHDCIVLQYDDKQGCIYFALQNGSLTDLSLDGIYNCEIQTEKERISCTGRIRERYCKDVYQVLKLVVGNGFYKISIKCVDK